MCKHWGECDSMCLTRAIMRCNHKSKETSFYVYIYISSNIQSANYSSKTPLRPEAPLVSSLFISSNNIQSLNYNSKIPLRSETLLVGGLFISSNNIQLVNYSSKIFLRPEASLVSGLFINSKIYSYTSMYDACLL